ncbi:MAG: 4a-hydroxytetrahydrobiopterin dehydratase [Acidobacteriota bacterium]
MKPERIQEQVTVPGDAAGAVQDFLDDHAGWGLGAGGSRLIREYRFLNSRIAAAFTQFVAEVADALDQPLTAELRADELRLVVGSGAVLTPRDLELAEAIAQVS